ncbi:DUF4340 domain-containing protein [Microcoleus sp. CZ3-B4]|uniref:DUF4340 domain-containing protein n=2 Tax=Oscillatoriales TaxID=1150 RepID=UPI002FD1A5DA
MPNPSASRSPCAGQSLRFALALRGPIPPLRSAQCPMPNAQFPVIMKLQKNTFVLIAVALSMIGFVSVYEMQVSPKQEEAKENKHKIFNFKSDRIQFFTVKTPERILTFERVYATKGGKSSWEMKLPVQGQASEASVDFLLDRLATGKSDRTINTTAAKLPEYGLDKPQATVTVKLDNQETHRLVLGKTDFSGRFLYALANPGEAPPQNSAENLPVLLVPFDFKNAVNRPLSEWKKAEAPKPEKSPTPSPTPSPENQ